MAGWSLLYHPDIPGEIERIPRNLRNIMRRAIEERLMTDPVRFGEPLRRSLHGYRKLRVGDYRIVYELKAKDVIVLLIGYRKDVYDKAVRRFLFLQIKQKGYQ